MIVALRQSSDDEDAAVRQDGRGVSASRAPHAKRQPRDSVRHGIDDERIRQYAGALRASQDEQAAIGQHRRRLPVAPRNAPRLSALRLHASR